MGMGVPQYRCREISQSLSLELVRWPPTFLSLAFWVMESKAFSLVRPEYYRNTDREKERDKMKEQCQEINEKYM